jgi:hypothetical protein
MSGMIRIAAIAMLIAAPLAIGVGIDAGSAEAQVKKTACPNKITAACKKGFERVCSQTDKNGCCTRSSCVQK